jgi:hypothetical protein
LPKVFFRSVEIQISHEDILHGLASNAELFERGEFGRRAKPEGGYAAGASDQFKCGGSIA